MSRREILKKALGRSLSIGIVTGVLFGIGKGAVLIHANRYLEFGLTNVALALFRTVLIENALSVAFTVAVVGAAGLALYTLVDLILRRRAATVALAVGGPVVGTLMVTAWLTVRSLHALPGYPRFRSLEGMLLYGLVSLGFIVASAVALWKVQRVASALGAIVRILGHPRMAVSALVLLGGLYAAMYGLEHGERPPGPNILLITVDTLRADHLGAYGYPRDTSPHIDRLAREGVLFLQAVTQWPKTSPSFASMFTSTYGRTNGLIRLTRQRVADHFVLLAELLRNARYQTAAVVANGNLGKVFNFHQGFDTYVEVWKEPGHRDSGEAQYVSRHAISWLKREGRKQPFFLWLHSNDPHARYEPPGQFHEMFVGDEYYEGSRRVPLNPGRDQNIGGIPARSHLGQRDEVDYYIAQYDAEIRFTDEQIGAVMRALEDLGLGENTIVILAADHGESLGEHNYYFEHGRFAYDSCARVPLIIRAAALGEPGQVVESPVELIDVVPTILELVGLPPHPEAEGKSLVPLVAGDEATASRWAYAFTEAGYRNDYQRAIRTTRWKLIYIPDPATQAIMQGRSFELYDIVNDPGETQNLIDLHPEVAKKLKAELFRWMAMQDEASGARPSVPARIDPATREQLRTLGYIE